MVPSSFSFIYPSHIYPSHTYLSLTLNPSLIHPFFHPTPSLQVISATVFGYVVANISTIVRDFNSKEQGNNLRLGMLKEYLNRNNSPASVSNSVLSFFRQSLRKGSNVVEDKIIMMRLPHFLRTSVYAIENEPVFSSIPIFKHIKSNSLKLYLLNLLTFCHAEKGYRMIKAGEESITTSTSTSTHSLIFFLRHIRSPFLSPILSYHHLLTLNRFILKDISCNILYCTILILTLARFAHIHM